MQRPSPCAGSSKYLPTNRAPHEQCEPVRSHQPSSVSGRWTARGLREPLHTASTESGGRGVSAATAGASPAKKSHTETTSPAHRTQLSCIRLSVTVDTSNPLSEALAKAPHGQHTRASVSILGLADMVRCQVRLQRRTAGHTSSSRVGPIHVVLLLAQGEPGVCHSVAPWSDNHPASAPGLLPIASSASKETEHELGQQGARERFGRSTCLHGRVSRSRTPGRQDGGLPPPQMSRRRHQSLD